jgi:hypothetical protein
MPKLKITFKQLILFSVFLFFCFTIFSVIFIPRVHAEEPQSTVTFTPQVPFGEVKAGAIGPTSIGTYVKAIYKYAIGIVGILAAVVLMFGGLLWLTAGGNANQVGEAKAWIGAALTGLIVALCSFMILATISPKLVEINPIETPIVAPADLSSSQDSSKTCGVMGVNPNANGGICPDGYTSRPEDRCGVTSVPSGQVCCCPD